MRLVQYATMSQIHATGRHATLENDLQNGHGKVGG